MLFIRKINFIDVNFIFHAILTISVFQGYFGKIELAKDRNEVVNDIRNGRPILYRIMFPIQNPLPKLTAIYNNDQLICSGSVGKLQSIQ